jgi:uncharacterized protein (TIGR03083 family)
MESIRPIFTVELFPGLSRELLSILRDLSSDEWELPTACRPWVVKDVAAHLLGSNIGRLSSGRDGLRGPAGPAMSYPQLVEAINRANAEWVSAAKGMSPGVLMEFLERTDREVYEYFRTLPNDAVALTSVCWADDRDSPNWFDIAREYTEKWLHQQHIREAVGKPLLAGRQWLHPVLDTFLRALPKTYRAVQAGEKTVLTVNITGDAGGVWSLRREQATWRLYSGGDDSAVSVVTMDPDTAWRLFTKGMDPGLARPRVQIEGDSALGAGVLNMVSIMA